MLLTFEAIDRHSVGVVEACLALAFVFVQHKPMASDRHALWIEKDNTVFGIYCRYRCQFMLNKMDNIWIYGTVYVFILRSSCSQW
jgi:hypothetical protein